MSEEEMKRLLVTAAERANREAGKTFMEGANKGAGVQRFQRTRIHKPEKRKGRVTMGEKKVYKDSEIGGLKTLFK